MVQLPKIEPRLVSAEKLSELYNQIGFQQKLKRCKQNCSTVEQDPWLDSQRKKEIVRHIDQATDEEVLVEAVYTDHPPGTKVQRIVLRLCNDDGVHCLRLL